MDILCDTNIWYDIGFGNLDPQPIKDDGHRLLATPVNFIEIASRIVDRNLDARRRASRAVLDHADEIIDDPERHLARIWQVNIPEVEIDWRDGFIAIAETPDIPTLESGVIDPLRLVQRSVNVPFATAWRVGEYERFAQEMTAMIDSFWPGYAAARAQGRIQLMPREAAEEFDRATQHPDLLHFTILATFARVQLHQQDDVQQPPLQEVRDSANRLLEPYSRVYQKYVLNLASRFAPQPNDWGDLECFIYAQEDRRVFTHDQRWIDVATQAGCEDWLFTE